MVYPLPEALGDAEHGGPSLRLCETEEGERGREESEGIERREGREEAEESQSAGIPSVVESRLEQSRPDSLSFLCPWAPPPHRFTCLSLPRNHTRSSASRPRLPTPSSSNSQPSRAMLVSRCKESTATSCSQQSTSARVASHSLRRSSPLESLLRWLPLKVMLACPIPSHPNLSSSLRLKSSSARFPRSTPAHLSPPTPGFRLHGSLSRALAGYGYCRLLIDKIRSNFCQL